MPVITLVLFHVFSLTSIRHRQRTAKLGILLTARKGSMDNARESLYDMLQMVSCCLSLKFDVVSGQGENKIILIYKQTQVNTTFAFNVGICTIFSFCVYRYVCKINQ